jgi:hypothetical protein
MRMTRDSISSLRMILIVPFILPWSMNKEISQSQGQMKETKPTLTFLSLVKITLIRYNYDVYPK